MAALGVGQPEKVLFQNWKAPAEKGGALDTMHQLEYHTSRRMDTRSVRSIGVSFNGRTADSGSANWGSNPCTPARRGYWPLLFLFLYPYKKVTSRYSL